MLPAGPTFNLDLGEECPELMEEDDFDEELEDSLSSPAGCTSGEESEGGTQVSSPYRSCVTLYTLLRERLISPGESALSIHYLGQTFVGDLLPNGKIKSQETDLIFSSPSAWAIHCKKIINPDKKSGCGWSSVKYKGRKLDIYKNAFFKKKRLDMSKENAPSDEEDIEKPVTTQPSIPKTIVPHNILGCRTVTQDSNLLVESVPFTTLGKIQPFLVTMSTNACMVMDFHCHLTNSEVVGYLAGHWDVNAHNLVITHAFPCRCRLGDRELAPHVEADIYRSIEQRRLTLIGWYHSHPKSPAVPSLKDLDAQLDYQMKMKGPSDATYTPCVGVICSPYFKPDLESKGEINLESSIMCYWVMPPPENRPTEYGRPMLMTYSVSQEHYLSQDALNEMKKCSESYKGEPDAVKFNDSYCPSISYLEKMKSSLAPKFPRDQSEDLVWSFIQELVSGSDEEVAGAAIAPKVENGHATDVPESSAESFRVDAPEPPPEPECDATDLSMDLSKSRAPSPPREKQPEPEGDKMETEKA